MPSDELIAFYNERFGPQALVRFVNVGKRRNHSPEHTLEAADEVYRTHISTPFTSSTIIGQMVHATAAGLHRQSKVSKIDAWDFLEKLSTPRGFRQKFANWMQWGKWE